MNNVKTYVNIIYLHPGSFLLPLQTSEPINQQTIQFWDSTSVAVYGELIELLDFETLGHLVQVAFVFFMFGSVCVFLLGGGCLFSRKKVGVKVGGCPGVHVENSASNLEC